MTYGIQLHIWGDFACFTRPEMKAERVSYDTITPSAARGVLEAIYWKPEIRWVVDRLHILKPIRWMNIRRNEVGVKASANLAKRAMKSGSGNIGIAVEDERQQRAALVLRDVAYIIEAHFDVLGGTDGPEKHYAMFCRRAREGQCFHRPYLGCREFPAWFALIEGAPPPSELPPEQANRELGYMLHDIDYEHDRTARFFRATMRGGVIEVPALHGEEVRA